MPFEEEFNGNHSLPGKAIVIGLIALVFVASIAFAAYKIISPPSNPVTVGTPATISPPSVNATSLIVGDTLQLTTTISSHTPGVQVFFYSSASASALGSSFTDSNGQAIFNAVQNTPGTFTFTADCVHP